MELNIKKGCKGLLVKDLVCDENLVLIRILTKYGRDYSDSTSDMILLTKEETIELIKSLQEIVDSK